MPRLASSVTSAVFSPRRSFLFDLLRMLFLVAWRARIKNELEDLKIGELSPRSPDA